MYDPARDAFKESDEKTIVHDDAGIGGGEQSGTEDKEKSISQEHEQSDGLAPSSHSAVGAGRVGLDRSLSLI